MLVAIYNVLHRAAVRIHRPDKLLLEKPGGSYRTNETPVNICPLYNCVYLPPPSPAEMSIEVDGDSRVATEVLVPEVTTH